ncbi:MAG: HAD-IIA family hydrolase [Verrucomicrobiota bacterium]|nr:HAD-IIA family hydrolase [Verrucomicrobiota bacterium]
MILDSFLQYISQNKDLYDAVFFDVDGTLTIAGKKVKNGPETIAFLAENDIPFLLLTNDGNHSAEEKSEILSKSDIYLSPQHLVSSASPLKEYAKENNLIGKDVFVMGSLGTPSYAEKAGLKTVKDTNKIKDCECIIIGENNYNWEKDITTVINFLIQYPEMPIVVANPDSYWPKSAIGIGIGAGGIARFIQTILSEYGIDINPIYLGKPYKPVYISAEHNLQQNYGVTDIDPKRILLLGDSLRSDILGANRMGFVSALILTGITTEKHFDIFDKEPELKPDLIFKSL